MISISPEQVRALRVKSQHLYPRAGREDLIDTVRSLCGVNAQFRPAMMLSLRARVKGLELADVNQAVDQRRTLVRTWAMRGTIHLLDSGDTGWIVALLGPAIIAKGRGRRSELGLDEKKLALSLRKIPEILNENEPLTRDELMNELIDRDVNIDRTGQAPYYLISYAALKGLICLGPDRQNGDKTYSPLIKLVDEQKHITGNQALAELIYRYLKGYGPASPKDFASWSGLSLTAAEKGWKLAGHKESLKEIRVEDRTLWLSEKQLESLNIQEHSGTVVNLLPAFDSFILAYSDREYLVPGKYRKEVYHGGQTVPVILVNGLAAGVWRYGRRGKTLNINISPFGTFDRAVKGLIEEEAEDIGRFLGLPASLAYI